MRYHDVSAAVAVLLLGLAAVNTHAKPLTVSGVQEIHERVQTPAFAGRAEWNALTYYLQGVIEGAAAYQQGLAASGKPALFCPPPKKAYAIDEFLRLLRNAPNDDQNRPASEVILEAYAKKYPCK